MKKHHCLERQNLLFGILIIPRLIKRVGLTALARNALIERLTRIFFPLSKNLKSVNLDIEVADTPEKRIKGLSGRENLPENVGLLFVYDKPGLYGIWMKDMNFPVDVIWLDKDFKVVNIAQNISPDSFPQVFEPKAPALYILEVNTGFAEQNIIEIGDRVDLNIVRAWK